VTAATPVIERVECFPLAIPYPTPRRFGRHVLTSGENTIVRVTTSDGATGLGEAIARPYIYGESQQSIVAAMQKWFAPSLIGRTVFEIGQIWRDWDKVAQNPAAKAALDMAVADLAAQSAGLPLWRWLGGESPMVPLTWILTYGDISQVVAEAGQRAEQGYRAFKVKISPDRGRDRELLTELRRSLPASTRYYGDANATLTRAQAQLRLPELEELGLELIEDPIAIDDLAGRHEVWTTSPLGFLADESAQTVAGLAREITHGGVDSVSIKIFRTGLAKSFGLVSIAEAFSRSCVVGGQGETDLGAIIAAHFASAVNARGLTSLPAETSSSYRFSFALTGSAPTDGTLELSDRPGVGADLDLAVLRSLAAPLWPSGTPDADGWLRVG
jgi:L-alanine-DL-glutamate epimerase-like enolase superfamily enzyme